MRQTLLNFKFKEVKRRHVNTMGDAPKPGEFCPESKLGTRKADFIVGLFDGRLLPIECKVSNSGINSIKRLNNDAAAKAEDWQKQFGTNQVVPMAILAGVFELQHLENAQERGLTLIWALRLKDLTDFIEATK